MRVGADVVLVDTGPLVALFDPSERAHVKCERALASLERTQLVTSIAVLTEATYLLAFSDAAQNALLSFVVAGAMEIADFGREDIARASTLMAKYRDLPMDFADATLVVLAERLRCTRVFTLDVRDFGVYRVGRRKLELLPKR